MNGVGPFLWLGLKIFAEVLTEFDENEFVVSDGFFEVGGGQDEDSFFFLWLLSHDWEEEERSDQECW